MLKKNQSTGLFRRANIVMAVVSLLAFSCVASGASISFGTDPFEGTDVRTTPGRQIVGNEQFIEFDPATDSFLFNASAFGLTQISFANGLINDIPSTGVNAVVLQTTDNDGDPTTPFLAGTAANLLAMQITSPGPGLFIYFNSNLQRARLVYSDDLSDNTADLKILARLLNFSGQAGIDALPSFTAANFQAVPEPSSVALMSGGIALLLLGGARRRMSIRNR